MKAADDIDNSLAEAGLDTLAIRAGQRRSAEGEHSEALFLTSSYVFANAAEAAARFSGDQPGNVYSRYTNPTVRTFEERIAALEGAEQAVATSSGMAAILSTCMAFLKSGDHLVCSRDVFGTTTVLLNKYLSKMGVETTFVPVTDLALWKQSIRPETKLLFLETPSNPLCEVADITALAELARAEDVLFVVDNCLCTPALQKPLALGADLVIHSATKYLDGQGRCLGGVVCGRSELVDEVLSFIRSAGPTMSPFNAWVFLKGLETLRLRMDAHSVNAQLLAEWLQRQPAVEQVFYAGLPDHPGHQLAARQQRGFGGVLSFRVRGGREQAWKVIDSTRILSLTANLGDAKTTIVHPATTTHGRLNDQQKKASGITENLIRVAVGLEDIEDIKNDLLHGLTAI
ncbi:MAG: O-succinylhomoserine sulfhydrylase [Porticoccus sp.]|uniref:O-succinylhomoserine sulfhydrylase n=1 Tax=Porticoccus hydrocarbonoclasticus TaxID=1073414 RepID=UPI0005646BEA|nr:O-succinylhomoserine sulfhydrylase [Porticoccus hydrocarbonoclasticus]MBG57870.1 O-succinylhomoserine sulfhydrylase [Porticoccus sp.]|tara:strand:+ start:7001 stop:8203 length:1203 start_codon:yes stop_codon:yes gene_type:complete